MPVSTRALGKLVCHSPTLPAGLQGLTALFGKRRRLFRYMMDGSEPGRARYEPSTDSWRACRATGRIAASWAVGGEIPTSLRTGRLLLSHAACGQIHDLRGSDPQDRGLGHRWSGLHR